MQPRHKFGAKPTTIEGIRFGSKKEASYYMTLMQKKREGEVLFFLRQVPIDLGGGVTYRCDYLVFWTDGRAEFIEVKGMMTRLGKTKIVLAEDRLGIKITVV